MPYHVITRHIFVPYQVEEAMDAITKCCQTGEGNLLDLSIKVMLVLFLFSFVRSSDYG